MTFIYPIISKSKLKYNIKYWLMDHANPTIDQLKYLHVCLHYDLADVL